MAAGTVPAVILITSKLPYLKARQKLYSYPAQEAASFHPWLSRGFCDPILCKSFQVSQEVSPLATEKNVTELNQNSKQT